MKTVWTDARELYRDLAKWEAAEPFTSWFTSKIESHYEEGKDWKVNEYSDGLKFFITQRVADEVAYHDRGLPLERVKPRPGRYPESGEHAEQTGWNQDNNPQTHAITGDDDI